MKLAFLSVLLLVSSFAQAQTSQNDSVKIGVEVFLSKDIVKKTELARCSLLNDIDVSSSQNLLLASNDRFFCVGYGDYYARRVTGKKISTFCVLGNDVYFADKSVFYKIGTDNKESKVMRLPFVPRKIWSGKQVVYAVCRKGKGDDVYAVFPEQKQAIQFYSTPSSVVGIDEFGPFLFILTEKSLVMIEVKGRKYEEFPVNVKETGKLLSLAIDQSNGNVYLSSANGIYRVCDGHFQKICKDVGILCYDIEGMLVFNNKDPFVLRLRNSFLNPAPQGVVIDIK